MAGDQHTRLSRRVIDDWGYLALVDPDAYETFVDFGADEWDERRIRAHLAVQMRHRRLLVWDSGMENIWNLGVSLGAVAGRGFREAVGPIRCTGGRLLLTSFNSLSMAAQFADVTLPEPHEADQLLSVAPGEYHCRIVQLRDHALGAADPKAPGEPDYLLELLPADAPLPAWTAIRWDRHAERA